MWAYSSPSVLRSFNHSKCEFNLFMCALIHRKLLNGLKLTPDTTISDLYGDNFQWGPLEMFCSLRIFLLKSIEMGASYNRALLDQSGKENVNHRTECYLQKPQLLNAHKKNSQINRRDAPIWRAFFYILRTWCLICSVFFLFTQTMTKQLLFPVLCTSCQDFKRSSDKRTHLLYLC